MQSFDAERALDRLGMVLLGIAVLVPAVLCWPEVGLGAFSVHDGTFHHALSLRLIEAVQSGENPLDAWVSFSSMGAPVWRSYQPLAHWMTATVMALASPFAASGTVMGGLTWLLLCLHPPAFFVASRWLGVRRFGAGVAALLCLAPVAVGNLNAFGAGYGSYVWRGSGVYTQLWAIPFFVLSLGASFVALRDGTHRLRAVLLLVATALCHLIVGWAAALSAALLALIVARQGGLPRALSRLTTLGVGVGLACAFLVVPALLDGAFINRSLWEPTWKWDSHGAVAILGALLRGELFDAGRAPLMTGLLAVSVVSAIAALDDLRSRALLGLAGLWLVMSFGRHTFGSLLPGFLVHDGIHMHRLVAVAQVCGVLLLGLGVDLLAKRGAGRRGLLLAGGAGLVLALTPVLRERAASLRANAAMGRDHRLAVEVEQPDLDTVFGALDTRLTEGPGRVFAGLAGRWGKEFTVGAAPAYHLVGLRGLDATSHLWHSMSIPSDALLAIDDASSEHLRRFGVRYLLAPADQVAPAGFVSVTSAGRFGLWALPLGGYFSPEIAPPTCDGDPAARLACARRWLSTPRRPAGSVLTEGRSGAEHDAVVEMAGPGSVVFRSSYHPGWRAFVDGVGVPTRSVAPGFVAIDVPPGRHDLRMRYRPGHTKSLLFLVGLLALGGLAVGERRGLLARWEARLAALLGLAGSLAGRAWTRRLPRLEPALWVSWGLALLATAPFFRGELVLGHDALEYPTRLAELHEVLRQGVLLPYWAPDLGAGFGQPMFGFVPPLFLAIAEGFHLLGLGLAGSLHGAVVVLALVASTGMYGLGRRVAGPPGGLLAAAGLVFGVYFQVELFVRAAFMEFSGLAMLPMALWLVLRSLERPGAGRVVAASVGVAALALSHNAVLLMTAPAFALFVVLVAAARLDRAGLGRGVLAGVGGLALSAWFWLPALVEKQYTHAERLLDGPTRWDKHFVERGQLWDSSWGFGLSVPGVPDGMSFELGAVLLLLAVLGLGAATLRAPARSGDPIPRTLVVTGASIAAVAVFMSHGASAPLWRRIELLQFLQFPWRFFVLSAVFLPLAASASAALWGRTGAVLGVLALLAAGGLHLEPAGTRALGLDEFSPSTIARQGLETTTFREFEPLWVQSPPVYQQERLDVLRGQATVRTIARRPHRQEFLVEATRPAQLQLATVYFPGWHVRVDGQEVPITFADSNGLPRFSVPAGDSRVVASFEPTPVRWGARALSLLAALLLAGSWWMERRRPTPAATPPPGPGSGMELVFAGGVGALALLAVFLVDGPSPGEAPTPTALIAQVEAGLRALDEGRNEDALAAFTRATEMQADSHAAWLDRGIALSRLGRHRDAAAAYARALELDPGSVDARRNLGVTWQELGDPERAKQYLEPTAP